MKFDKDTLIKHRFWLLLAATVPMILVAVFLLITSVSASIEAKKKEVVDSAQSSSGGEVYGPAHIAQLEEVAAEHKKLETAVHKQAYEIQGDLMTFPKAVENRFNFSNGLFATEIKIVNGWKKDDPESWPANDDHLFHGIVKTRGGAESITVEGKDGKDHVFYRTPILKVEKTAEKKEGEGEPDFADIGDPVAGNLYLAITYYKSKYFYDPLTTDEEFEYARTYRSQLQPILQIVDPVNEQGEGVVQLKGWLYNRNAEMPPPNSPFLRFVANPWKIDATVYKEVWLAQEDLWIQREMYRIIREANDMVALCVGRGGEDKSATYSFRNPNYEFKIKFDGPDKLVVTAKNNQFRRQKLDVWLRIRFNKADNPRISTEKVIVADEPLDPRGLGTDERTVVVNLDPSGIERTGIYSVEQVLTWETAPIKRLDEIAIGGALQNATAHSHRTIAVGSKPYRAEDAKQGAVAQDAGGDPMGGGMPAPVMQPMGGGGFGDQFGAGQANVGVNGVLFDRYIEVTDQSRRVPVGIALIVDQDHVDRVLTAFNNSKLRFLTTQVLINRYPNSVRPQLFGQKVGIEGDEAGGAPPPFMPMMGPMGGGGFPMGGGLPMGGDFAMGGFGMPGAGMAGSSGEELENNVELVIYGIATLYERYPKRKIEVKLKTPEAAAAP
jgi:hypothetical protein